jgi:hypothetical protein
MLSLTVMPGAKVASTRRIYSAAVQRRRRWTEVMISMRSEVLVIRSVISLTLPKWETLSGHFGGNLSWSVRLSWGSGTSSQPIRSAPAPPTMVPILRGRCCWIERTYGRTMARGSALAC